MDDKISEEDNFDILLGEKELIKALKTCIDCKFLKKQSIHGIDISTSEFINIFRGFEYHNYMFVVSEISDSKTLIIGANLVPGEDNNLKTIHCEFDEQTKVLKFERSPNNL